MPQIGLMNKLLKMFAYLQCKSKSILYFNSGLPRINHGDFIDNAKDFAEIYCNVNENMPIDMLEPRRHPVVMSRYAERSFATNCKMQQPHLGFSC